MSDVRVCGLSVAYGQDVVLRDVDVVAHAGAVTGVIGPNGAGKSTLLKTVAGLVRPLAGRITVGGRSIAEVRTRIAYLPQRGLVDWDYPATVADVVAMGRYPLLRPWHRFGRPHRQAVDHALRRVDLLPLRDRHISQLSGGQQQRMFFARALAQEAAVLLLDEPFVGVDGPTVDQLSRLLRGMAADGAAVVVVNHDLHAVRTLCDQLVLLNGALVAQGEPADVLYDQVLARAYGPSPLDRPDTEAGW